MRMPFIVAEVSANHQGARVRAEEIIDAAAAAGANAVKFQAWTRGTMTPPNSRHTVEGGTWAGRSVAELYEEAYTPWEWFPDLFKRVERLGMMPFASAFDAGALAFLEDLNCPMYKIASFEAIDLDLIKRVARTGKHVVISTGMADFFEIRQAIETAVQNGGAMGFTLLHCVSAYPAPEGMVNLQDFELLRARFMGPDVRIGLSDHTMGVGTAVAAVALGATMIEKHLTIRRAHGGLDAGFSQEPDEFKAMVQACRQAHAALGRDGSVMPRPDSLEDPQRKMRRSLYYRHSLVAGTPLEDQAIMSARPAEGMHPHRRDSLIGRVLKAGVVAGQPIRDTDFT